MGAELKKITIELDRALKLKSQLLQASLNYLDILSIGVTTRNEDVQKVHNSLQEWTNYLDTLVNASFIKSRAEAYQVNLKLP